MGLKRLTDMLGSDELFEFLSIFFWKMLKGVFSREDASGDAMDDEWYASVFDGFGHFFFGVMIIM